MGLKHNFSSAKTRFHVVNFLNCGGLAFTLTLQVKKCSCLGVLLKTRPFSANHNLQKYCCLSVKHKISKPIEIPENVVVVVVQDGGVVF